MSDPEKKPEDVELPTEGEPEEVQLAKAQALLDAADQKKQEEYIEELKKLNEKYGYKLVPNTILRVQPIQPGESVI